VDLRGAAQGVRVLHGVVEVVGVARPDLEPSSRAAMRRRFDLAGVGTETRGSRIEGPGRAHQRLHREGHRQVGDPGEPSATVHGEHPIASIPSVPLSRLSPSLASRRRGSADLGQHLAGRSRRRRRPEEPLPDQGQRQVGEGGEVAGGPDRALRRAPPGGCCDRAGRADAPPRRRAGPRSGPGPGCGPAAAAWPSPPRPEGASPTPAAWLRTQVHLEISGLGGVDVGSRPGLRTRW
jgi:hypothetical protein